MKKLLQNKSLLYIAALIYLASCGNDEGEPTVAAPSVTITATTGDGSTLADAGEVQATDSVMFSVSITAPGGFNTLDISGSVSLSINRNDLGLDAGVTQVDGVTFKVFTTVNDEGAIASIVAEAIDETGQTGEAANFSFSIIAPPSPDAEVLSEILIAPPLGDGSSQTFFSIGDDTSYSHNDVTGTADPISSTIDLGYYYGATDLASLAAPSAYPASVFDISAWTTRRATEIEETMLTVEEFMALQSVDDVSTALGGVTFGGNNIVTDLSAGDILAFRTVDTEPVTGFIHVVAITGTDGANDSIELDFILNQEATE